MPEEVEGILDPDGAELAKSEEPAVDVPVLDLEGTALAKADVSGKLEDLLKVE